MSLTYKRPVRLLGQNDHRVLIYRCWSDYMLCSMLGPAEVILTGFLDDPDAYYVARDDLGVFGHGELGNMLRDLGFVAEPLPSKPFSEGNRHPWMFAPVYRISEEAFVLMKLAFPG